MTKHICNYYGPHLLKGGGGWICHCQTCPHSESASFRYLPGTESDLYKGVDSGDEHAGAEYISYPDIVGVQAERRSQEQGNSKKTTKGSEIILKQEMVIYLDGD